MNRTTSRRSEPVDRAPGGDPGPDVGRRDVEARDRHVLEPPARARAARRAPRPAPPPRSSPGPGSPRAGARSACWPRRRRRAAGTAPGPGAASRSSVSAVTDGPSRSTSTRDDLDAGQVPRTRARPSRTAAPARRRPGPASATDRRPGPCSTRSRPQRRPARRPRPRRGRCGRGRRCHRGSRVAPAPPESTGVTLR